MRTTFVFNFHSKFIQLFLSHQELGVGDFWNFFVNFLSLWASEPYYIELKEILFKLWEISIFGCLRHPSEVYLCGAVDVIIDFM